jgi:hypothetical protein
VCGKFTTQTKESQYNPLVVRYVIVKVCVSSAEPDWILRNKSLKRRAVVAVGVEVKSSAVVLTAGEFVAVAVSSAADGRGPERLIRVVSRDGLPDPTSPIVEPSAFVSRVDTLLLESVRVKNSSRFSPVSRFATTTLMLFSSCTGLRPSYRNWVVVPATT